MRPHALKREPSTQHCSATSSLAHRRRRAAMWGLIALCVSPKLGHAQPGSIDINQVADGRCRFGANAFWFAVLETSPSDQFRRRWNFEFRTSWVPEDERWRVTIELRHRRVCDPDDTEEEGGRFQDEFFVDPDEPVGTVFVGGGQEPHSPHGDDFNYTLTWGGVNDFSTLRVNACHTAPADADDVTIEQEICQVGIVPEPTSLALLGSGLVGLGGIVVARRRRGATSGRDHRNV